MSDPFINILIESGFDEDMIYHLLTTGGWDQFTRHDIKCIMKHKWLSAREDKYLKAGFIEWCQTNEIWKTIEKHYSTDELREILNTDGVKYDWPSLTKKLSIWRLGHLRKNPNNPGRSEPKLLPDVHYQPTRQGKGGVKYTREGILRIKALVKDINK